MLGGPFVDDAAADDGLERHDVLDLVFVDGQRVGRQDRKISELPDLDRAGALFGKGVSRRGAGVEPQRLFAADRLLWTVDRAA